MRFKLHFLLFTVLCPTVYAFENNLFVEMTPEFVYTDKQISDGYGGHQDFAYYSIDTGATLGWFGRFNSNLGLIADINVGFLNLHQGQLPSNLPESLILFKAGIGAGYFGQNFIFYASPGISSINNSIDFRGTLGAKAYLPIDEWGISIGFEIDSPLYRFDNQLPFEPKLSFRTGVGIIYNLTYKKRMELKAEEDRIREQEQVRLQEEQRQNELENQRIEHERMLKEKGITEEEWQAQENEKKRQAEIRRAQEEGEREALSKLIQNLIDIGYNIGDPFHAGEIVVIPYGLFRFIDYSYSYGIHSYLVIMNDYSTPSKPFYIESEHPLDSIGSMRIQYLGVAQYLDNRVPRNTLRFKEVR